VTGRSQKKKLTRKEKKGREKRKGRKRRGRRTKTSKKKKPFASRGEQRATMAEQMPQALEQEYKEAFSFFDPQGTGKIDAKKLVVLMRALGQQVTENDVAGMCSGGSADLNSLLTYFRGKWSAMVAADDLVEAFSFFDPSRTGSVSSAELTRMLTNYGEPLTQAECDELLRDTGDPCNYQQFVQTALSKGN
jgi:calmodulin